MGAAAQFALTACVASTLPPGHPPFICHQGTDNSAADAAAAKGITMTPSMSNVLGQYFLFMRRTMVFSEITHIPGHQNAQADLDPPESADVAEPSACEALQPLPRTFLLYYRDHPAVHMQIFATDHEPRRPQRTYKPKQPYKLKEQPNGLITCASTQR